ncbi:hypothetical protein HYR99_15975 [Candidatus Poribacteria bacterium]|nr:hypothetical protein [Candidatus Poribacteria bacterium]
MEEEKVYFSHEKGVKVTSTRLIVGATTYPLAGIASVKTEKVGAKRRYAIWTIIIGLLVAAIGFKLHTYVTLTGAAILAIGVIWLAMLKDTHILRISTAAGEVDALKTKGNRTYIRHVADALNEAIVQRG